MLPKLFQIYNNRIEYLYKNPFKFTLTPKKNDNLQILQLNIKKNTIYNHDILWYVKINYLYMQITINTI